MKTIGTLLVCLCVGATWASSPVGFLTGKYIGSGTAYLNESSEEEGKFNIYMEVDPSRIHSVVTGDGVAYDFIITNLGNDMFSIRTPNYTFNGSGYCDEAGCRYQLIHDLGFVIQESLTNTENGLYKKGSLTGHEGQGFSWEANLQKVLTN